MIHFQYVEYFLALALLPLLIICFVSVNRWKRKVVKKIGDKSLVEALMAEFSVRKFRIKFFLFIFAFVLCGLAVAGLVRPDPTQKIARNGADLMIALDVSNSMLATDVKPDRLERAKQLISKLIDQMPDERIGLIIFAGRAYLQMPLTIDHNAAKMYVSAASTDDVPVQGTVVGSALRMSLAAFDPKENSYKSVLLISDGEDHDDDALPAAKELAKQGIMVNTIGIGSPMGSPIPDATTGKYKVDEQGHTVISKLNEQELSSIAKETNGIYQLYNDPDMIVQKLKDQLAGLDKSAAMSDNSYLSFIQYYWYFLLAAFIVLLLEMIIPESRRKFTRTAFPVLLIFMSFNLQAQSVNESIRNGNKSYEQKKYDDAAKDYQKALDQSDKNYIAGFNMGNTLYRKDDLDGAVKYFDKTIDNAADNNVKQQAYYNKGVAYQKANKLPECILAYKNALLLNPNDEDARQNLQRALKNQQEQQKKDNKKDNKDQDKKKQEKNPQQPQQPKPQQSKISKKDAEQKLKALMENEKALQDKLQKRRGLSPETPSKDW